METDLGARPEWETGTVKMRTFFPGCQRAEPKDGRTEGAPPEPLTGWLRLVYLHPPVLLHTQ